jgi:hypothetical protein
VSGSAFMQRCRKWFAFRSWSLRSEKNGSVNKENHLFSSIWANSVRVGFSRVSAIDDNGLPRGKIADYPGIQWIGRMRHRVVKHVGTKQAVPIGKMMVYPHGKKIFAHRAGCLHEFICPVPSPPTAHVP